MHKAGYVAVAGAPNVGKSTLMNRLVGSQLSIVTPKPQTTRSVVRGILSTENAQIIFFDTAGIHRPQDSLGEYMVDAAERSFQDADIVYAIVECALPGERERELLNRISPCGITTFLIINKVDRIKDKKELLPVIAAYRDIMLFDEIIPVSALSGENTDSLLECTVSALPEAPPYYPEDIVSDQIERDFIGEIIREQLFLRTKQEIPYSSAVVIDDMKERGSGKGAFIQASVYVEKESQKAIIIGSRGTMIRDIGRASRERIEQFLGYRVYLDLQVKVEKKWRDSPASLRKLGYR